MASPKCENLSGAFLLRRITMTGVRIKVRADATQAKREMRSLEQSVKSIDAQARKLTSGLQKLAIGITAAFAGSALTKGITRNSDAMVSFGNKINLVTKNLKQTDIVMNKLFKTSADTRSGIEGSVEVFNRFGLALRGTGKSTQELINVTELVNKAAILSGAGAEASKGAIVQLGQGLAAGQLRGEELNSVLEAMPRLALSIAEGMGIPFGKLKDAAQDGLLTAEAVFKAIIDGGEDIRAEFATLNATVGELGIVFGNEWTRAIANLDKVIGVSSAIKGRLIGATNAVKFFGENIVKWGAIGSARFSILKADIKFFAQDAKGFLKNLFTGNIDATKLVDEVTASLNKVREDVKERAKIALDFTVSKDKIQNLFKQKELKTKSRSSSTLGNENAGGGTKIDLVKDMFPGLKTVTSALTVFKDTIIGIFQAIHERIVGKCFWTGIFDPDHKEPGQKLAIGEGVAQYLGKPLKQLNLFGKVIIKKFKEIYENVSTSWLQLNEDVKNNGLKPTFDSKFEKAWDTTTKAASTSWDALSDTVFSKSNGKIDLPLANEISDAFDESLESIKINVNKVKSTVEKTSVVLGVKVIAKDLETNLDDIKQGIKDYFDKNAESLAAIVSLAFSAAFSKGLRGLLFSAAIGAAILASVASVGNNPDFVKSVETTARSWGKLLGDYLATDGDVIKNVTTGISNLAGAIGKGFVEGFTGQKIETELGEGLAKTLGVAMALTLFSPKFRKGVIALSLGMAKAMFGVAFKKAATVSAVASVGASITSVGVSPLVLAAITKLGITMGALFTPVGALIGAAIIAGFVAYKFGDQITGWFAGLIDGISAEEAELKIKVTRELEASKQISTLNNSRGGRIRTPSDQKIIDDEVQRRMMELNRALSSNTKALERINPRTGAKFATGGHVQGAGTGTSDDIPAMLSNGEFVVKSSAVKSLGLGRLNKINQGILPKFGDGGLAGTITAVGSRLNEAQNRGDTKLDLEMIRHLKTLTDLSEAQVGILEAGNEEERNKVIEDVADDAKADPRRLDTTSLAESFADSFKTDFTTELSHALKTGDTSEIIPNLAASYSGKVIDGFVEGFTDTLFGDNGPLTNMFTSGINFGSKTGEVVNNGLQKGLSAIKEVAAKIDWGKIIQGIAGIFGGTGYSQGGVVRSVPGSQAGKDSVPAMLMPGEVVLSKNALANMRNGGGGQQSTFNINVSGDVSRQTRKEIVKMMPQITGGVNAQNKESNHRR